MKQLIAVVPVWLMNSSYTLNDLSNMTPERAASTLAYYHPLSVTGPAEWIKVGSAEVTITFDDVTEITSQQIVALRAERTKIQADCECKLNQIDGRIQSLLAIECKP